MKKAPWWYWPVAAVPGVVAGILCLVALQDVSARLPVTKLKHHPVALGICLAVYAALVLLGYLLLVLCRPSSPPRSDPPDTVDGQSA
ncbi:MAG TPA: hypothetical protein VHE61_01520 [Opitutaceae bacterium]|nr:hypothetical protein [Opitutaceae bacterium]